MRFAAEDKAGAAAGVVAVLPLSAKWTMTAITEINALPAIISFVPGIGDYSDV
jgi:hypothetical protein